MSDVRRVVLTGVESTGKTTLAEELAAALGTIWVPEYGREYTYSKHDEWTTEDFVVIAREQQRQENEAAQRANQVLICDTNAFATCVWHQLYMGFRAPEVEAIGDQDTWDLTFLAAPDFPWVPDDIRVGEENRLEMHQWFIDRLSERPEPFVLLQGDRPARLERALAEINTRFGVSGRTRI